MLIPVFRHFLKGYSQLGEICCGSSDRSCVTLQMDILYTCMEIAPRERAISSAKAPRLYPSFFYGPVHLVFGYNNKIYWLSTGPTHLDAMIFLIITHAQQCNIGFWILDLQESEMLRISTVKTGQAPTVAQPKQRAGQGERSKEYPAWQTRGKSLNPTPSAFPLPLSLPFGNLGPARDQRRTPGVVICPPLSAMQRGRFLGKNLPKCEHSLPHHHHLTANR